MRDVNETKKNGKSQVVSLNVASKREQSGRNQAGVQSTFGGSSLNHRHPGRNLRKRNAYGSQGGKRKRRKESF